MDEAPLLPEIGFGTAPLAGFRTPVSEAEAAAAIEVALETGYRYFDTAPLYGYGLAERRLGRALAGREAGVRVSTKVGRLIDEQAPRPAGDLFAGDRGTATFDFSADGVARSLEASLRRMGRSYVDLVLIHDPDDHAAQALGEAYPALEQLRAEGAVGAIGVGMNRSQLPTRFVTETDIDVVLIAGRYTLLERQAQGELFGAATARGVHVVVGGVYNSGVLTGNPTTATFNYEPAPAAVLERTERLRRACAEFGVPLAAAAAQFAARHPAVGTTLLGAASATEATQNWDHLQRSLPEELWPALEEAGRTTGADGSLGRTADEP
ncbi:MAG: aldo/keto reductase [bacterium]|nr:aldo/keto reductase [bacterium]